MNVLSELDPTKQSTAPPYRGISALKIMVGLFGAPVLWIAQMALSEPLVSYACYPYHKPLSAPIWEGLPAILAAISIACLAGALLSGFVAWTAWRKLEVNGGRTRFLVKLGLMSSFLFTVAIIFNSCALLLVPLCGTWF